MHSATRNSMYVASIQSADTSALRIIKCLNDRYTALCASKHCAVTHETVCKESSAFCTYIKNAQKARSAHTEKVLMNIFWK
eukprot:1810-Heterococcus_DN1.PRE.2